MGNAVKRHEYFLPFPRIFTQEKGDAYDSILFESSESYGDESIPALTAPATWSAEAVSIMADASHKEIPADLRANEENTVPSWLWRHQSRSARRVSESDLRDIFNRVVGSATASGWKNGLFTSERHARAFYDEARYALMQRVICIHPNVLKTLGVSWAYGLDATPKRAFCGEETVQTQTLSNTQIDSLVERSKSPTTDPVWKKFFSPKKNKGSSVSLRLSDIAADWHSAKPNPARALLDVLALRHEDGSINIDAVRHVARLLTLLLDLQGRNDVTIGIANLSSLLLANNLAFDSEAGRAMAAAVVALVTAECLSTSAEIAALRGMGSEFVENRDSIMRTLRNHWRAVYGDDNDYEKLSVLPTSLPLTSCPDLSLVSETHRTWDETLERARDFGLRTVQVTNLTPSSVLGVLMDCSAQGVEPLQELTKLVSRGSWTKTAEIHPAVHEAFQQMSYSKQTVSEATRHIVGTGTIKKAPKINDLSLKALGFDDAALEKIYAYMPSVNTLKLAVTPWVVGVDFCKSRFGVAQADLNNGQFCLLHHLGFSDDDVEAADHFCFGHKTLRNAKCLPIRDRAIFACGREISNNARLKMAAAIQSFVTGDTGVRLDLPDGTLRAKRGAEMTLVAWRLGIKSLDIAFDPSMKEEGNKAGKRGRKLSVRSKMTRPIQAKQRLALRESDSCVLKSKKQKTKRRPHATGAAG